MVKFPLNRIWPVAGAWSIVFTIEFFLTSYFVGWEDPRTFAMLFLSYSLNLGYALNGVIGRFCVGGMYLSDWRWLIGACVLVLLTAGYVLSCRRLVRGVLLGLLVAAQLTGIWFSLLDMVGAVT